MIHRPIPLIALSAALLALAACQTTDSAPQETITWDKSAPATPDAPPAQQAPPPKPLASAPPKSTESAPGEPQCREYQTTITIDGKPQKAYGRACRQPDGTWKDENVLRDKPYTPTPPSQVENSHPYGWRGYRHPYGPFYGRGGLSVGVGAGRRGGYMGYGVGF